MTIELMIGALLGLAAIVAMLRLCYRHYRAEPDQRSRVWRLSLLLAAQPLGAVLLYFALLPPRLPGQAGTMIVSTAGAVVDAQTNAGDIRIALPEAPATAIGERVPDLATALRRHPDTQRLRVFGLGLESRDRDAVRGLPIEFTSAPWPRGVGAIWAPMRVGEGEEFALSGRVQGVNGGSVELLDPGAQRVDRSLARGDGGFALSAVARGAGLATFKLRLRDAEQRVVEEVDVPISIEASPAPKLLLLAGAPGPELKYLRRWAIDAGLKPHTQIEVGAGLRLGDAPLSLNAATLAGFDLLILDERAWESLGEAQRAAVVAALRNGLCVLLRVGGSLSPRTRTQLRELGFEPGGGADATELRLPATAFDEAALRARLGPGSADAPRSRDEAPASMPMLTRRVLTLDGADLQPLGRDAGGKSYAAWRAVAQGRMALWGLGDSFRLVLAGREDLHGRLWSDSLSVLTRARANPRAHIDAEPRQDTRVRLCNLSEGARVVSPSGVAASLLIDANSGGEHCAGFWPTQAGWHVLKQGDRAQVFYVRGRDEAPGLRASELREATAALSVSSANSSPAVAVAGAAIAERGSPWPWFGAWLLLSAGLWWLERSRRGRDASSGAD